jgi:hypothetical protein
MVPPASIPNIRGLRFNACVGVVVISFLLRVIALCQIASIQAGPDVAALIG